MKKRPTIMRSISLTKIIDTILFLYIFSLYLFTYRSGYNLISNGLSFVLIALIWIYLLLKREKIVMNKYVVLQLLFLMIIISSNLYAINTDVSFSKSKTLLLIFLLSFSILNYMSTRSLKKMENIFRYFIFSGFFASLYILFESDLTNAFRMGDVLGNQNAIGMIISISSIIALYLYLKNKKKFYLLMNVPMITTVLLTGSRKSLLFLILAIIYLLYEESKTTFIKKIRYILISLLLGIIFYYLIFSIPLFYEILGTRIENLFNYIFAGGTQEASIINRESMIKFGIQIFREKPILGYGIDNYRVLYGDTYSHNNFIELLTGVGIIGFGLFYTSHMYVLYRLRKKSKGLFMLNISHVFIILIIGYTLLGASIVYYDSKHFTILIGLASIIPSLVND